MIFLVLLRIEKKIINIEKNQIALISKLNEVQMNLNNFQKSESIVELPESLTISLPINTMVDFYSFNKYLNDKINMVSMVK